MVSRFNLNLSFFIFSPLLGVNAQYLMPFPSHAGLHPNAPTPTGHRATRPLQARPDLLQ